MDVAEKVLSLVGKIVKFRHMANRLGIVLALRANKGGFYPASRYPAEVMVFDTMELKSGCAVKGSIFEYALTDFDLTTKPLIATQETAGSEFFTLYQLYLERKSA